ncbi:Receptor-type tyrosine-protein phosphatase dep-1 [Holothuria leucospilota]|uniref:protein-tyrosine-phosphatase n=1 Tax=Holothuria leucospilota TaxID=206669 RepID=A0A9Q1BSQ1_HOLLE|nr:Receptor-type tyrosine-protein phosphatase dep-1 [Holothuria leucospilota]
MELLWVLIFTIQAFVTCYGRDATAIYTIPNGGCSHHELDNLRPNTTYHVTVTTIIPGRSAPQTEVQKFVSDPAPLNTLRAWNVGTNDLSVFWLPGHQILTQNFTVQIVEDDAVISTTGVLDTDAVNNVQFNNLAPATLYEIEILQGSEVISSTRIVTRPRPPTLLTLTSVTTTSLTLQWQPPPDNVNHYEVCYHPSSGIVASKVHFSNEIELSDLIPGTTYTFTVIAIAQINGAMAASTVLYGFYKTVSETNPATPERLRVMPINQNSVRVSWDPPSGSAEAFELDYVPQFGYPPPPIRIPLSQYSIQIDFLQSSTDYQFSLTATKGIKLSRVQSAATEASVRTEDGTFNIEIFNIRDTSAEVLYGYEPEAVTYSLLYGPQDETKLEKPIPANIPRQYSLWNLRPETEYVVDVIAFDVNGEIINQQSATFMTLLTPSVTPTIFQSTATSSTLSFPLPSEDLIDFDHYEVQLHFGGDGSFGARIDGVITVPKSACAIFEFEDLKPDTLYEVVTSVVRGGSKTLGTVIGVSTRPLGPLEISAALVTSSTIEIVWGPGEGDFTEYELIYITPSSATVAIILQREINRHVLIDLQPGTIYQVTLSQLGGAVVESNTVQLTTRPLPPTNLLATTVRTQSASFSWNSLHDLFSVCYFPQGNTPTPYMTSSTEVTLSGFQPETAITVTVVAISQVQLLSYRSNPVTITTRTLAVEPGEIQVDRYTTTTIDVSWIGLPGANNQYQVEFFNVKTNSTRTPRTTDNTEYSITNLVPGALYNISVVPVNTDFPPSTLLQRTFPNPPGDITVTRRDVTAISLTWQEPTQTEDYEFLVEVLNLRGETIRQVRVSLPTMSFNDLMAGTNYTFSVSTVSGMGIFETLSSSADITSGTLLNMRLTPSQSQLNIEWDPVDYGAFSCYEITYTVNEMLSTATVKLSNNLEEIVIENLTPGSRIHVKIDIINDMGDSVSVGVNRTVLVPLEVTDLRYTARRTEISLEWDLNPSFYDGFEVSYTPMDGLLPAGNISRTFGALVVGLTPGQEYTLYVTTLSNGERSEPVHIVAITLPEIIPSLELIDLGEGDLSISWEEPVMRGLPVNSYTVIISEGSNGPPVKVSSDASQSRNLLYEGTPGFYYSVEITSVVVGVSGMQESEPIQRNILMKPSQPQFEALSEEDVGATFVSLSWTTPGARSYYNLTVRPDPNNTIGVIRIEPQHVSTRLENLVPLTSYEVTIFAVSEFQVEDGDLKVAMSAISLLSFTTKHFPPRNLSTTFIGKTAITWVWLPPVVQTSNTLYRVVLSTGGSSIRQIVSDTTLFEAMGLNPETEYTLMVQVQLEEVLSLPIENTAVTLRQKPAVITGFGIPDNTDPSPEITLVWDPVDPGDDVTSILIKINGLQKGGDGKDTRTERTRSGATSYTVTNLVPGYSYNFSICAVNDYGSGEPATDGPFLIPETAPPATNRRVNIIATTSTTITAEIRNPFFSDMNGVIVSYALLVTRGSEDDVVGRTPNTYLQSQMFESSQPPYQTTPETFNPYRVQSSDGSGLFEIGTNEDCLLVSNFPVDEYCNGPLQPSTSYRVALRGYGVDGTYTDSLWSDPAVTGFNNIFVWVISACFLLLILILMIILCCICWCCRSKRKSRPRRRRLYPENQQASNDVTSLENFRLPDDENAPQNGDEDPNAFVPELTSYRKKRGAASSSKRYKRKKNTKRSRHRRRDRPTSSTSLEAESTTDDMHSSVTTLATASSNPIVNSMFQNHVANMSSRNNAGFIQEFQNMETLPNNMSTGVATMPENMIKNRYRDVLPYDATRVVLLEPSAHRSDYINASHIQWFDWGRYISAQAPIPNSVNDFWQMIWENKTTTIVMLTKLVERGSARCEKYWPDYSETLTFGNFVVAGTDVKMEEKWQITTLQVKKNDVTMQVNHFHFLHWPDRGIPINPRPILEFIREIRKVERTNLGPLLVHCSAGCGRSGTFIALDILLKKLEMSTVNDKTNVLETVYTLRQQRMKMVQTSDQYTFLHRCLAAYIHELFYSGRPDNRSATQR